ncbi:IS1595 family transposase [bacterium]|nr:IS1595 family transposase [bacterium]
MAQNKVQFQDGISLPEFMVKYGTDEQCEKALFNTKWPYGFKCECCEHDSFCYIKSRQTFQCTRCKYQTSVKINTIFHSSKVPLSKWFLAIYLISQNKNGIAALSLKRQIGVSYKTAWSMKHKLMQAMSEKDAKRKLFGLVTIDDAYLGGQQHGGKRGRGSEVKQPFVAAISLTSKERPLYAKFTPVESFTSVNIGSWAEQHLYPSSVVATDGFASFNIISKINEHNHVKVPMQPDRKTGEIPFFHWLNTILGNVKNAIAGTYRSSRKGYGERYLSEFQYRFNRRFYLRSLFISLIYTASYSPPLPWRLLQRAVDCK